MKEDIKICWCCTTPLDIRGSGGGGQPFLKKNGAWDNICKTCRKSSYQWLTPNRLKFFKKRFFSLSFILKKRCTLCDSRYEDNLTNFPVHRFHWDNRDSDHITNNYCMNCCKEHDLYVIRRRKKQEASNIRLEKKMAEYERKRVAQLSPLDQLKYKLKEEDRVNPGPVRRTQALYYLIQAGIEPTEEIVEQKVKQLKMIKHVRKEKSINS